MLEVFFFVCKLVVSLVFVGSGVMFLYFYYVKKPSSSRRMCVEMVYDSRGFVLSVPFGTKNQIHVVHATDLALLAHQLREILGGGFSQDELDDLVVLNGDAKGNGRVLFCFSRRCDEQGHEYFSLFSDGVSDDCCPDYFTKDFLMDLAVALGVRPALLEVSE
ncbi:MAG: hypothetical protein KC736_04120 [Candidatus Moranbacteria bacterium]|nr:hypothetical protein [Candidatus Moranbacteria bacterium]